jgi:hypothetical protein
MKSRKKRVVRGILAGISVLIMSVAVFVGVYAGFPGKIKDGTFQSQVMTAGLKSSFRQGVAYRYPGLPPLVEVSGDPYDMGLQYGVLLRSEIVATLNSLGPFLKGQAKQARLPYFLMTAAMRFKAGQMAHRLPRRYTDEMRGVADGAGISAGTVATVSLLYDIYQSMMACTGVLMRGPHGSIIQGRLNDMAAFGEISRIAAIVRHKPKGLNSFVHMDVPLYLGVETGLSDKGLSCGGETLRVKKPDGRGFSHPFLMRLILEEAGSLEEIYPFFDRYHQVGADGVVWSDLRRGRGAVVEITPTAWAKRELESPILWDFNRFYDESLARQQSPAFNISGGNIDREAIASAFPKKAEYTIEDAVDFIRNQTGPDGTDYAWCGTKLPVCNRMTTQMMIFDSASDGFYLAMGPSFASRRTIWHIFSDFTKQPELFLTPAPVHPLAEKTAEIENSGLNDEGKLGAMIAFADDHAHDANAQFLVAYKAFRFSRPAVFSQFAERALDGKPAEPEYRLFAGLAAYQQKDLDKAIALLESAAARNPEQELFRLAVLERAWADKDAQKASLCRAEKQALLDRHGVREYFKKKLQPLLDALEKER